VLSRRHVLLGLGGLAAGTIVPGPTHSAMLGLQGPLPRSSAMSAGKLIPAPAAWFALLEQHPELDPATERFAPVKLTNARAALLIKVQREINRAVAFRDDERGADLWQVADREGDCEDYAIRKLATLIQEHGFPRGALTLAACLLGPGRGHAVLLVHTDLGVYALDNLSYRVMPWRTLPYDWIAREEPGAPFRLWRSLPA
jgi:predicted transglutaminase-like cysteine proteinase